MNEESESKVETTRFFDEVEKLAASDKSKSFWECAGELMMGGPDEDDKLTD